MSKKDEVCIIFAGSADAGKSTLGGVLLTGKLDNGNGSAREIMATHKHEIDAGKSSDISIRNLEITPDKDIVMVDVCGQKKYFKTTARAFGQNPDFAVLVIAANRGIVDMTREHLQFIAHSNIPLVVAITREDLGTPNLMKDLARQLRADIAKEYGYTLRGINVPFPAFLKKKMGDILSELEKEHPDTNKDNIKNALIAFTKTYNKSSMDKLLTEDELSVINPIIQKHTERQEKIDSASVVDVVMEMVDNNRIVPIVTLSNKTGYYISVFRSLLSSLKSRKQWDHDDPSGVRFYIDNAYVPPGVGLVVSGLLRGKSITSGMDLWIGPHNKQMIKLRIKTIHNNVKQLVDSLDNKHRGCLAIRAIGTDITRKNIRKGMIIASDPNQINNVCFEFSAVVQILHHPTTISTRFTSVIHCGLVRQTARIQIMDKKGLGQIDNSTGKITLRTEDHATVKFRFLQRPEYIEPGSRFFFRGGETIGVGMVKDVLSITKDNRGPEPRKKRFMGKRNFIRAKNKKVTA
jgi:GTPase